MRNNEISPDGPGTNRDIQVVVIALCKCRAFFIMEAHDHPSGFVFNRGNPRQQDLILLAGSITIGRVTIQFNPGAVGLIVGASRGVTDAEACRVFYDQPGK